MYFDHIPIDILNCIFFYLDYENVTRTCMVSKQFLHYYTSNVIKIDDIELPYHLNNEQFINKIKLPSNISSLSMTHSNINLMSIRKIPYMLKRLKLSLNINKENDNKDNDYIFKYFDFVKHIDACESFGLQQYIIKGVIFSLLPQQLHYLELEDTNGIFKNDYISGLPRTLITLKIITKENYPLLKDEYAMYLPRSLTYLKITHSLLSLGGIAYLPPMLQHLKIGSWQFGTGCISHLPRNLISLILYHHNDNITNEDLKYLPPYLTCLKIKGDCYSLDNIVNSLPVTLKCLEIRFISVGYDDIISSLPNLVDLRLGYLNSNSVNTISFKLIRLDLFGYDDEDLKHEDILNFPRTLTHLSLFSSGGLTKDGIVNLPKELKYLKLYYTHKLYNSNILAFLPKSLTYLGLWNPQYSDVIIRNYDIINLPKTLKTFELYCKDCIKDEYVKHLPPNLNRLVLSYNNRITDKGVKDLPRSLIHLNLQRNNKLTHNSIPHLPRSLNIFKIGVLNISPNLTYQTIHNIPKSLIKLKLQLVKTFHYFKTNKQAYLENLGAGSNNEDFLFGEIFNEKENFFIRSPIVYVFLSSFIPNNYFGRPTTLSSLNFLFLFKYKSIIFNNHNICTHLFMKIMKLVHKIVIYIYI